MKARYRSWIPGLVFWTLFLLSVSLANRYRWLDTVWVLVWLALLLIVGIWSVVEIFRSRHDTEGYVGYRGVPRWFVRFLGDDEEYHKPDAGK